MTAEVWYGNRVEVDAEATRAWYAGAEEWGCTCGHCRNYLALADKLPEELAALLGALGIPPPRATYVGELYDEDNRLFYELDFRVAGRVLEKVEAGTPWGSLRCKEDPAFFYPFTAKDFPKPCFELNVQIWLPWVLDEPIGGVPTQPGEEEKL